MMQSKNEYSAQEVAIVTGWSQPKVCMLSKRGQIKKTRRGFYDKASVDKYQADRDERKAIAPAVWVKRGTAP
jgi:hypothetical protein